MRINKVLAYLAVLLAIAGTALSIVFLITLGKFLFGIFQSVSAYSWWTPLVWTPLLTVGIVYVLTRYIPGAAGTGSPHAIIGTDPRLLENERGRFLSVKIAVGKIFLTATAFLAGLSLGNEGPAVQIGASLMHSVRKVTDYAKEITVKSLIMMGNGIGIAVCFGSAIGGILFCVERMHKTFFEHNKILAMFAIFLSAIICMMFFGFEPHFGAIAFEEFDLAVLVPILLLIGLVLLTSTVWTRAMIYGVNGATKLVKFRTKYPLIVAGVLGFIVAAIGIYTQGTAIGASDVYTHEMFDPSEDYSAWFAPAKLIACVLTAWSGVSAGMFIPMLNIGGGIGAFVGKSLGMGFAATLVAVGMVGFLAAVSRAPLASTFIVADITGAWALILLLLIVAIVCSKLSSLVCPDLWNTQIDLMMNRVIKERQTN